MPTIFKIGPYRFFFYAGDRDEPVHVHIERDDKVAKFWLDPVRLKSSGGFNRLEVTKIHSMLEKYHSKLMEAWHEYFGS